MTEHTLAPRATGEVPVVDVGPFLAGEPDAMAAVAAEIGRACEEIGFFQITGHGVPDELVERVDRMARAFFDRSDEEKAEAAQPSPDQVRGWSAVGKEGLSYSLGEAAPGDLKEKMDMGPFAIDRSDPYFSGEAAGPHFAPTPWPSEPAGMQAAWEEYFTVMSELSRQLMRMFAVALDLDVDFFEDKIDRHISMLRALNYPDQPDEPLPGQLRAGAHSDYGSLTIVRQEDRPGGLQVKGKDGAWHDVPAVPGAFVVNIGDLMAEWTNDRWVSTMHRVVNPEREVAANSRRLSLVFFHQPNYDAMVECLPTCLAPGETPRHEPVTSGDHLYAKFTKQTGMGTTSE